jgi:hypothetical protein
MIAASLTVLNIQCSIHYYIYHLRKTLRVSPKSRKKCNAAIPAAVLTASCRQMRQAHKTFEVKERYFLSGVLLAALVRRHDAAATAATMAALRLFGLTLKQLSISVIIKNLKTLFSAIRISDKQAIKG